MNECFQELHEAMFSGITSINVFRNYMKKCFQELQKEMLAWSITGRCVCFPLSIPTIHNVLTNQLEPIITSVLDIVTAFM